MCVLSGFVRFQEMSYAIWEFFFTIYKMPFERSPHNKSGLHLIVEGQKAVNSTKRVSPKRSIVHKQLNTVKVIVPFKQWIISTVALIHRDWNQYHNTYDC